MKSLLRNCVLPSEKKASVYMIVVGLGSGFSGTVLGKQ